MEREMWKTAAVFIRREIKTVYKNVIDLAFCYFCLLETDTTP